MDERMASDEVRTKSAKIRYRKRGVPRTKLQVYVSNEAFDRIYALSRQMKVSMGAAVEKLAEGGGTNRGDSIRD